ncbi:MAG: hypothetical protein M0Q91_09915 [Methanoregula sp.]|jgi:hypothetical protein|nr:hypothetical protein [Methanoregula sp.]
MINTAAWEILADMFDGTSTDTVTKMKIGYGTTAAALTDSGLEHAWTNGGFETATIAPSYNATTKVLTFSNTFTNTSGSARTVREAGLYTTTGGVLVDRQVLAVNDINNFCIVPDGETITITFTWTFQDTVPASVHSGSTPTQAFNISYRIYFITAITGEISGSPTFKMIIGYGYTPVSESDIGCEHSYADGGFEPYIALVGVVGTTTITFSHTFTNISTTERPVREVVIYTELDGFLGRYVFAENDIENLCIVPATEDIDIVFTLTYTDSTKRTYSSCSATGDIDLTSFAHPGPIDYNGIALPNPEITDFSNSLGTKTWAIKCSTDIYADVTKVIRYAGPITTGKSITGKQYVISSYRSGVLYISAEGTFYNVYMEDPVNITPFGKNWLFTVKIYESAYVEVV